MAKINITDYNVNTSRHYCRDRVKAAGNRQGECLAPLKGLVTGTVTEHAYV